MRKIFVEYKIKSDYREPYLKFMSERIAAYNGQGIRIEWLEGADQAQLFVEIWHNTSEDFYLQLKKERTEELAKPTLWEPFHVWIEGGRAKIHVWEFKQVTPSSK
ncbi:hypothetical protein SY83_00280 [Paenibacillus swuensis]|uniref:NIPSNAP domain-containing protein n=1 Tax=Paenibacillus swuensis TaxID=1178515 RepID=A0A172TDP4_9BACL|nr:hypothetical protein [Paenibacillus swuensis]ANE45072.1 hypothetical protein SY83_00280 [Paenibacillus swuensis]